MRIRNLPRDYKRSPRATATGGQRYAGDYQVIWPGMSIGRIMRDGA
jgi:hypothetical protein